MNAKEKAIILRKEGYSYSFIKEKTGLAKSTLSYHLAEIPFRPNKKTIQRIGKGRAQAAITKSRRKKATLVSAQKHAEKKLGELSERDTFILGLGLYIGEGSKTQDLVRLVNADAKVIKLFIRWLHQLGLKDENITIRVHLYPESNIHASEQFWLNQTGLSRSSLQRACIDTRVSKDRKRQSAHPYGTAHVTVRANGNKSFGVILSRQIGAYMKKVLQ